MLYLRCPAPSVTFLDCHATKRYATVSIHFSTTVKVPAIKLLYGHVHKVTFLVSIDWSLTTKSLSTTPFPDPGVHIKIQGPQRDAAHRLASGTTKPVDGDWKILRLSYGSQLHNQSIQLQGEPTLPSPKSPVSPLRSLLGVDPNTLKQPCDLSPHMTFIPPTVTMSQYCYDTTEVLDILLKYGADIYGPGLD
jgi:hypothetical protein